MGLETFLNQHMKQGEESVIGEARDPGTENMIRVWFYSGSESYVLERVEDGSFKGAIYGRHLPVMTPNLKSPVTKMMVRHWREARSG